MFQPDSQGCITFIRHILSFIFGEKMEILCIEMSEKVFRANIFGDEETIRECLVHHRERSGIGVGGRQ